MSQRMQAGYPGSIQSNSWRSKPPAVRWITNSGTDPLGDRAPSDFAQCASYRENHPAGARAGVCSLRQRGEPGACSEPCLFCALARTPGSPRPTSTCRLCRHASLVTGDMAVTDQKVGLAVNRQTARRVEPPAVGKQWTIRQNRSPRAREYRDLVG